MSGIYAKCPVHGIITVSSKDMRFVGTTNVTFSGRNIVRCPKCGQESTILNGTFDFDDEGTPEFISGPEFTRSTYNRFEELVNAAKEEGIDEQEFVKRTEDISPLLAKELEKYIAKRESKIEAKDYIGFLFTFLTLLLSYLQYRESLESLPQSINVYNTYNQPSRKIQGFYPTPNAKVTKKDNPVINDVIKPKSKKNKS